MPISCVISSIDEGEDALRPVILNFENGAVEPEQADNLMCRYYKNKKNEFEVGAATKNMLYRGLVESEGLCNTFIGICNKKKTKMRLVAVDFATLAPKFDDNNDLNTAIEKLAPSNAQLSKSFGSKRAKRKTEQREKMKMDVDAVKEQLEQTVAEIVIDAKDAAPQKIDEIDTDYKPRINREAEDVLDVYNVNDLVSTEVLESTSEEVQRILGESAALETSPFVTQQMKRIIGSKDSVKNFKLQLLLYIDCLFKFMHKQAKELGIKSLQFCSYSKTVQDDILKRYTIMSGKSRCRPNSMRDKCLCTILVLSMIACQYKLNLEVIAKELKLGLKRVQEVSRVLGFQVSRETAVLSLPLPPPVNMFNLKRKRK